MNRIPTWLALIIVAVGGLFAAVLGLVGYLHAIPPLHPDPQKVPSVSEGRRRQSGSPRWRRGDSSPVRVSSSRICRGCRWRSASVATIVWAEGFGWADIENRVPVAPGMRFRIGHVSKALTSAAVGLLREKGRLHLDDEIQTYVPAFPRKQWPVTLRQLMGHVAGVRHYRDDEWGDMPSAHCERASEGLQSFADDPLLFEPETQYRYSTYGWVLVSAAVEAAANEPFFTFMRTQIFEPLGMADTTSDSATEPIPDRATFYYPRFSGDNRSGASWRPPSTTPVSREPARSCRRRPTWCGSGWR